MHVIRHYETLGALVDCAKSRPRGECTPPSEDWDFNTNTKQAHNYILNGWAEGGKKVREMAERLKERIGANMGNTGMEYRDDGGPMIDVARYCEGEAEHFLEFAPEPQRKPVTIVLHVGAQGCASAEQFYNRGAAVLAAAEILQTRGFIVTIKGINHCSIRSNFHSVYFPIHDSGTTIDSDMIAFTCAHPAMHRRIGFDVRHADPKAKALGFGYDIGASIDPSPEHMPEGIYVGALTDSYRFSSDAETDRWVIEICKRAGCDIHAGN